MGTLVTLSGPDSAGKSTQVSLLEARLRARGVRTCSVWHRPGYSGLLDGMRKWARRVVPSALPGAEKKEERERIFKKAWVRRLWASVALLESAVHYGLALRLKTAWHQVTICDRYWRDGLLDLVMRFPDLAIEAWLLTRVVEAVAPRPNCSLLLRLSPAVAACRAESKSEPFPDSAVVRESRFLAYETWSEKASFVVIDAERAPHEVHLSILAALKESTGMEQFDV